MEELKAILRANHIQVTQQRLEVLRVLRELNTHVTADDVVNALKESGFTLTLATVYNILTAFERKGLIMKIGASGEPVIYDVNTFPHFHVYDNETREVQDYIDEDLMTILSDYFRTHPLKNLDMRRIDLNLIGHIK